MIFLNNHHWQAIYFNTNPWTRHEVHGAHTVCTTHVDNNRQNVW